MLEADFSSYQKDVYSAETKLYSVLLSDIKLSLGLIPSSVQCILASLFLGIKWMGCEADESPPSSAQVKKE